MKMGKPLIPPKPSSRHSVACVGPLVDNVLTGCTRAPIRFVVSPARNDFGLGTIDDGESPAIKVCGACSRHIDQLVDDLQDSCPIEAEPAVFTIPDLLENWDAFFTDLALAVGKADSYQITRHNHSADNG